MSAIATHKLSKKYPGVKTYSLHNVTFTVEPGEVYGFLGANGAGKSTAIRTLMGFMRPTSGSATILGKDIVEHTVELKHQIGYLSGDAAFYPKMTGAQFLQYLGDLQRPKNTKYVDHLVDLFKAEPSKLIRDLSKGNRQKFGLIQALMHEPDVLILDEPTSGLDPLMQEVFYDEVILAKNRGAAVLVSSHNLAEVQRMCDRVGFIRAGKLVAEQSITELLKTSAQTFDITFVGKAPLAALQLIKHAIVTPVSDSRATVQLHGEVGPLLSVLSHEHVLRLDKSGIDLEEEFLKFYENKPAEHKS